MEFKTNQHIAEFFTNTYTKCIITTNYFNHWLDNCVFNVFL